MYKPLTMYLPRQGSYDLVYSMCQSKQWHGVKNISLDILWNSIKFQNNIGSCTNIGAEFGINQGNNIQRENDSMNDSMNNYIILQGA